MSVPSGLVAIPKQEHLLRKLVIDSGVVFTAVEDGTGVFTEVTPVELPKRSRGCYRVVAEVATLDTTSCRWRATTCDATFAHTFEGPVFLMAGVFLVVLPAPRVDADDLLGHLKRMPFQTLQRFCRTGPDAPFDHLLVSREEWMNAYAFGAGCRNEMFGRIKRCHLVNGVASAATCWSLPDRETAYVFRAALGVVARSEFVGPFGPAAVDGRHDAPGRLEVEVACEPKKGTVVIPVHLSVNGCVMFEFDDAKEQIANARLSTDSPMTCVVKAWQNIKIAGNGAMQVSFRYCKLDIASLVVREGRKDVSVTVDALGCGREAEISETSVLTATWTPQAAGAVEYPQAARNPQVGPQAVPHSVLLGDLKRMPFQALQRFCRMGPDAPFDQLLVSREEWMNAYASVSDCQNIMFERIKRCHLAKAEPAHASGASQGGPRAQAAQGPLPTIDLLKQLQQMPFQKLQRFCRMGPDEPFHQLLESREEWMNAYASVSDIMFERIKRCHQARDCSQTIGSPQAASRCPVVDVEAFIKCICSMPTEELQQLCDDPVIPYTSFLAAAPFRRCWASATGCRLSMLRSIAYSLGVHHPMITFMRNLNEDAAGILDCLEALRSCHPATLQKQPT